MHLTPEEVRDVAADVRGWMHPAGFANVMSEGKFLIPPHVRMISEAIVQAIKREAPPMLIVEAPPRHGKSELISKWLPAWYSCINPDHTVALCSYGQRFAQRWGRKARDLVVEYGHHLGVSVPHDVSSSADWETNFGGGMVCAGVGGPLTGRGANLLIIDDPIKDQEEALSETIREKHWDWWESTAETRLEPGATTIVMMTRWHRDDLIGKLLQQWEAGKRQLRRIRLPAIAEPDDLLSREVGEALWPDRYPIEELLAIKNKRTPYWWQAMYQQRPVKHAKTEWPAEYFEDHLTDGTWPDKFQISAIAVDPSKGTSTEAGDYCAIVFVGVAQGKYWCWPLIERIPAEQIAARTVQLYQRFNPDFLGIEGNAFQHLLEPLIYQHCRDNSIPPPVGVVQMNNVDNKHVRIARLGSPLASQLLRIHPHAPGTDLLIQQLEEFPLANHDDGPDALEMAIRIISRMGVEG